MKKFIALLLSLMLLCGSAMAQQITEDSASKEAQTNVTFTIAAKETYIVTIPPTVELAAGNGSAQGKMSITISAPEFNNREKAIAVYLTRSLNAFKLVCGAESLAYAVQLGGAEVKAGDEVLLWNHANKGADVSAQLDLSATYAASQTAGQYTDTITFTVRVIDRP